VLALHVENVVLHLERKLIGVAITGGGLGRLDLVYRIPDRSKIL
jgi:hypothetical protein